MQSFLQRLTDDLDQFIEQPENAEAFLVGPEKHAQFTPLTGLNDSAFYADFSRSVTLSYRAGGIQIPDNLATHIVNICNLDALPAYAMITGNTEQRYLRIHFLRNHRGMFQAVIDNELRGMAGGGIGVLNQFLEALPREINIIRLSNYITEKDNDVEKGQIELIGYWDLEDTAMTERIAIQEHMKRELSDVLQSIDIEDAEGVRHGPLLKLVDLSPPDLLYPRVFISYSTRHEPERVQLLMNRLWENHFEPVLGTDVGQEEEPPREDLESDDPMIAPTMVQTTFHKIKTCVALISLHVKRPDFCVESVGESGRRRYIAPPWIIAEEVFAWSKRIQMVRIKDKAVEDPRYSRDILTFEFDSNQSYVAAVEETIEHLNSFRQSSKFYTAKQLAREAMFRKTYPPADR